MPRDVCEKNGMKWEQLSVGPLGMNCYLLQCEESDEAIIVDPGDEIEFLLSRIDAAHARLQRIIITHGHFDHIRLLAKFQDITKLPTFIHPLDRELLTYLPHICAQFGLECAGVPRINGELADGQSVKFGRVTLQIVHTPGHSPGSISLIGAGYAVVGDVLFRGSIGRTDLPGGSSAQLLETIHKRLLVLDDSTTVLPGHGDPTTIGFERRSNPSLV